MDIVIASNNPDKISEIRSVFTSDRYRLLSLTDFPQFSEAVEDGNTLTENALKKASHVSNHLKMPALADDTGLEVNALNGAPGVYSARYAGENATYGDNVNKLLEEMSEIPPSQRTARFRTVAVFCSPDLRLEAEGTVEGRILTTPRGQSGFGYDPVFFLPGINKTFAEMTLPEKNAVSHRGIAFRNLYKLLLTNISA